GDDELWRARQQARERLVAFVRQRVRTTARARGMSEADLTWVDDAFDPSILTVGFARRFAPYKRATLLLSQPDRLAKLLLDADRPMQLLFAGKAHPADNPGKEIIREVVQFARNPELRHRVAFLEDYDIGVARLLYQGCDVWLNTPVRPMEACGTSGEKAALNGALNCSILDGWWDELYDGLNGWAIPSAEMYSDRHLRDQLEAGSLFDLFERQIVPLFYEANPGRPPGRWLSRVRRSLRTLGPEVTASRMVRDYVEAMYEPAAAHGEALAADTHGRARALAEWKRRVRSSWSTVSVETVDDPADTADLGGTRTVAAVANLGSLGPDDVQVQLVHGPVSHTDEIVGVATAPMSLVGPASGALGAGHHRYQGTFTCEAPGRYGFTVRVVPFHPDLLTWAELGCMAVARAG
ncbi:MAG TPA: alpha-glucan family phosphorylase, partial [Acidimicrobiales bacterium]|nr:alpha-glucan family phosphorylase [Acidimicrobiales bacterium]